MRRFVPSWAIAGILILSFTTVWLRLTLVRSTYELNQATKILQTLQLDKERMDLKVAQLRSPRRLELLARTKFALHAPAPTQVVFLRDR